MCLSIGLSFFFVISLSFSVVLCSFLILVGCFFFVEVFYLDVDFVFFLCLIWVLSFFFWGFGCDLVGVLDINGDVLYVSLGLFFVFVVDMVCVGKF